MPSLQRGASWIIRISSVSGLVIRADHLHRPLRLQVVKRQVNGTTAVMPRSFRGVGYENFLVSRRGVPANFGHIPGPVGVVNEQAVPERLQLAVSANDRC